MQHYDNMLYIQNGQNILFAVKFILDASLNSFPPQQKIRVPKNDICVARFVTIFSAKFMSDFSS